MIRILRFLDYLPMTNFIGCYNIHAYSLKNTPKEMGFLENEEKGGRMSKLVNRQRG